MQLATAEEKTTMMERSFTGTLCCVLQSEFLGSAHP